MPTQEINYGTTANDGTGDTLRNAAIKINANFADTYQTGVLAFDQANSAYEQANTVLGSLKISGSNLGTQGENNTWGGSWLYLDPAGEGWSGISIPSSSAQDNGGSLQIYNNKVTSGSIQLLTYVGSWNFNNNGTLTTPTLTVDLHNGGNQNGQVLQFGDPNQQAIITGPSPEENTNAQRLIIQGQKGIGTGEGGDVYLWAGDTEGTNGGDIKIYAGDADDATAGSGGYINIDAGNGFNNGGDLTLTAGNANGADVGVGGDVSISAGGGTTNGSVYLNAGGNYWQFKPDGRVQFPNNTLNMGNSADLKGNNYAELWYSGVTADWHADASRNEEAYVWTAFDGTFIQQYRGADGNNNPTWSHQWSFGNDGKFTGPAMGGVQFGGAIVSSSGNYYQIDASPYNYSFISNYEEPSENRMTFAAVPADQIVINGAPQGPNNIFGYAVAINDSLTISGYNNDSPNISLINTDPNGSLKLTTNVNVTTSSTIFNKDDAYTTATWSNNQVIFTGETNGFDTVLNTLHIGDAIDLYDGETTYSKEIIKRYNGEFIVVDSNTPTSDLDLTSVTFDIKYPTKTTWEFSNTGILTLAGALVGSNTTTTYVDTMIEINLNATVNKLTTTTSTDAPHYHLADGYEGQIMYIVPGIGGEVGSEYTTMVFAHARYSNSSGANPGVINEGTDVGWWLPFRTGSTCLTLTFTDGYWNLPHNQFD